MAEELDWDMLKLRSLEGLQVLVTKPQNTESRTLG